AFEGYAVVKGSGRSPSGRRHYFRSQQRGQERGPAHPGSDCSKCNWTSDLWRSSINSKVAMRGYYRERLGYRTTYETRAREAQSEQKFRTNAAGRQRDCTAATIPRGG